MYKRAPKVVAAVSLVVVSALALLAMVRNTDAGYAWTLSDPERVVPILNYDTPVQQEFHLRNDSTRALRVLGRSAC
jgi:hypothetical protein